VADATNPAIPEDILGLPARRPRLLSATFDVVGSVMAGAPARRHQRRRPPWGPPSLCARNREIDRSSAPIS